MFNINTGNNISRISNAKYFVKHNKWIPSYAETIQHLTWLSQKLIWHFILVYQIVFVLFVEYILIHTIWGKKIFLISTAAKRIGV